MRLNKIRGGNLLGIVKKFEFDDMNKWFMHNSEFILENETHKIFKNFDIQVDHLISDSQRKKRTRKLVDFDFQGDHWIKLKKAKRGMNT